MCQSLVINFGAKSSIIKALSATLSQICHYKVSFLVDKTAFRVVLLIKKGLLQVSVFVSIVVNALKGYFAINVQFVPSVGGRV
jgi:hypothetical protein